MRSFRSQFVHLAAVGLSVVAIASCDTGPVTPKFGNGIAGGTTGTAPITPPAPGSPDTGGVGVVILDPATTGQLVNVGDSLLVVVRAFDDRQLTEIRIQGMKFTGDADLGTLVTTIRYPTVFAPVVGGTPFRVGLVDTTVRRFLRPATPIDSTLDSLVILAIATDQSGNVDTARRRVNLVTGPAVTVLAPSAGDSVPQNVPMTVSVRVQHNAGVRVVRTRIQGETTWPASAALDTTYNDTIVGTQRDVTVTHLHLVPATAPPGGRITITASAIDITSNPGSAAPLVVFVRQLGTSAPRVTQIIPERMEITDTLTVIATGDGIARVGFIIRDSTGAVIKDFSVATAAATSNVRVDIGIDLPSIHQGKRVRISTYADDQLGVRGFSVPSNVTVSQTAASAAHTDSSLIVYGISYKLPREGIVGDMQVDTVRSNVIISNMSNNRLEVWRNPLKVFDTLGVAVGSEPWGLAVSISPDTLLVANSGGTNVSRVFLGNRATGDPRTMAEDLPQRIRTRTNFLITTSEAFDAGGAVHFGLQPARMFSDRPQYIGQTSDGIIYFSTKPTSVAPEGTVRYLDPSQPFPDLRTFVFVRELTTTIQQFTFVDLDSAIARAGGTGIPDTLYLFDHLPGTNQASIMVRSPTCNNSGVVITGRTACTGATDPRFDPRFPEGVAQGALNALVALHSHAASGCVLIDDTFPTNPLSTCSDSYVIEDATPVGITDTTFVSVSADRNWIAFGQGNSALGFVMMVRATPGFVSPLITQIDLTQQAAERVFGLAIDSTGLTIAAHGTQSFYSAVDEPFHLRLQGIYGSPGTGGAGIAYHPRANGTTSPVDERLSFVADGDRAIHAVDVAFFIKRGKYDLKHQLYGPLRVSRRMAGDDPSIVLKLYGISLTGGLTVIDLRAQDILPVP